MTVAGGDFRKQQRKRVLMHAIIIGTDGEHRVRITDLTESGARLAASHGLRSGVDVIFKRGMLAVAAHVAWATRTAAGIKFYRKLDCGVLLTRLGAGSNLTV